MKMLIAKTFSHLGARVRALASAVLGAALLSACGGGGDPLSNPSNVSNPGTTGAAGTQNLSFVYFERCIFPIFNQALPITQNGVTSTNTCAGGGCHDSNTGTGGALRVIVSAQAVAPPDPASSAAVTAAQATDMYKNFYSAQGTTVFGNPLQSRLFDKPLVLNVLHGGGRIFDSQDDPHVKLIAYWINHPVPTSEFSDAAYSMFTPAFQTLQNADGSRNSPPTLTQLQSATCNTQ